MSLFDNLKSAGKKDSRSNNSSLNHQSDILIEIIHESIEIANISPDLETKKARLDYAMKKTIDLLVLANRYRFIESKKLSSIYNSIREVRNEIKLMESVTIPFGKREVA